MQRFFFIAAEPSGDILGAQLIKGLRQRFPEAEFRGIAGPLMEAEGEFSSLMPLSVLSIMNPLEILKKLFFFRRLIRKTADDIMQWHPTALITIDSYEFSLRISERVKGCPRIHCVAPTVWAWRKGRAKYLHQKTDYLLCLFPFETSLFPKLPTFYVGHPLLDSPFLGSIKDEEKDPLLCLLPGSRTHEITTLLPLFWQAAQILQHHHPKVRVVIVTLPCLRPLVESLCPKAWVVDQDRKSMIAKATLALAASGTVSLELATLGTPMVIAYRVSSVLAFILRRLIKTPYVALINILAQKPIVPELIQEKCTVKSLAGTLKNFFDDSKTLKNQKNLLKKTIKLISKKKSFHEETSFIIENILIRSNFK